MRMSTIVAACLLAATTAHAQERHVRTAGGQEQGGVFARVPLESATVKNAPYSADTMTENAQTLADGNRIARKVAGRVYRDGEGRTRREEDRQDGTATISIVDPVANVSYRLDPQQRIAWKSTPEIGYSIVAKAERQNTAGLAHVTEPGATVFRMGEAPLEEKTIDGVRVQGRSTTTTIPAGTIGNELPITIVSEEWRSPELKILIRTHYSDPRMGDSTYRVTNVVRAEPDPSLFQVPPGYTIREAGIRRHEPRE